MKKELVNILACPVCKGPLKLAVAKEDAQGVVAGSLSCGKCNQVYPVEDSIPNLLPRTVEKAASTGSS